VDDVHVLSHRVDESSISGDVDAFVDWVDTVVCERYDLVWLWVIFRSLAL
jgi:hypothetical protein